jgi:flagellar hook-basal body complex protein FliE
MTEAISPAALGLDGSSPAIHQLTGSNAGHISADPIASPDGQFENVLASSLQAVDQKVSAANDLVRQFAVDDSIAVHEVTFALEEARLSMELAMHVRERLVETYRELMNMQL